MLEQCLSSSSKGDKAQSLKAQGQYSTTKRVGGFATANMHYGHNPSLWEFLIFIKEGDEHGDKKE